MNADTRQHMTLSAFKPLVKGTLRGFAIIRLPIGLIIADVPVYTSHGRIWASLPAKPVLDVDGWHMADAAGKKRYMPLLQWADRTTADRWSVAVVALVRQQHPGALDDGGGR